MAKHKGRFTLFPPKIQKISKVVVCQQISQREMYTDRTRSIIIWIFYALDYAPFRSEKVWGALRATAVFFSLRKFKIRHMYICLQRTINHQSESPHFSSWSWPDARRQVHRRLLGWRIIKSETARNPIPWASDIAYIGCFWLILYLIIEFLSFQVYLDEITSSNICNSVHCRLFYSMLFIIYISRIQWLWHLVSCVPGSFLSLSLFVHLCSYFCFKIYRLLLQFFISGNQLFLDFSVCLLFWNNFTCYQVMVTNYFNFVSKYVKKKRVDKRACCLDVFFLLCQYVHVPSWTSTWNQTRLFLIFL